MVNIYFFTLLINFFKLAFIDAAFSGSWFHLSSVIIIITNLL